MRSDFTGEWRKKTDFWYYTINQVPIDTLKTSGNYMVLVSLADSSIDCYRFGGILYNNNDTTFIITDVFAKRKTCVFKKIR